MSSETEVTVTVVGGNDNSPKFEKAADETEADRRVAVPAGLGPVTSVYALTAADVDRDALRFGVSGGNASDFFSVDPISGKISTSRSLSDWAPASALTLQVSVWDGGIPNRTDSTSVTFLVTADNLHAPEFQSPATRIYIREDEQVYNDRKHKSPINQMFSFINVKSSIVNLIQLFFFKLFYLIVVFQIGNTIVTLKASDADEGINGQVEYTIISGDPVSQIWS
jgi:hypothetical protein